MRFLRNPMSLKVVDQTISSASDLFRGISCASNDTIFNIEMTGLKKPYEEVEDEAIILGGSVTGRIHSIPTVKELLENIISEAEQIISKLPNFIKV
jgi:hypothetical protein